MSKYRHIYVTQETSRINNDFTHIGLKKGMQRKIAILSKVIGPRIYELVAIWANDAWEMAKKAGMVTDAMLEEMPAHWVGGHEEDFNNLVKRVQGDNEEVTRNKTRRLTSPPPDTKEEE